MKPGAKILFFFLLALALLFPVSAYINNTAVVQLPANDSIGQVGSAITVNVTFTGTANITLNATNGTVRTLNTSNNVASVYVFLWNFSNGSFTDGQYNLTVRLVNSTNASDNITLAIRNITVDNTPPASQSVLAIPNATYGSTRYTNATPLFQATLSDASGIALCYYAKNSTDDFLLIDTFDNTTGATTATCSIQTSPWEDGKVFNVTFRATDRANNTGANATRLLVTVDASAPQLTMNMQSGGIYSDGSNITVNVSASDAGSGIVNSTQCIVLIGGDSAGFTGTVRYNNATGACLGNITLGRPSGIATGTYTLSVSLNDSVNNTNTTSVSISIDNTAPLVPAVNFSTHHPASANTPITINITASDVNNVSAVLLTNGSANRSFSLVSGTVTSGIYQAVLNLSEFGCLNETICRLNVSVNDTLGNTNSTVWTGALPYLLYIDSDAPSVVINATNVTAVNISDVVLFFAKWADIAFADSSTGLWASIEVYNTTIAAFDTKNSTPQYYGSLYGNYTNFTYAVTGAYEGETLIARLRMNNTNGLTNTTSNLSVTVANHSPYFAGLTNNSFLLYNESIVFSMMDRGSGGNLSSLRLNITGVTNTSISYAGNASLFNCSCATCGLNVTNDVENRTCSVQTQWPLGDFAILFSIADLKGNTNQTSYAFYALQEQPDIINISMNGVRIANSTPASIAVSLTNSSAAVNFSWTTASELPVANTTLQLLNISQVDSNASLPWSVVRNLTAGVNYVKINMTMVPASFTDTVTLNITANVPLNLSLYRQNTLAQTPLITDFNVTSAGADITNTTDYINKTVDITLTVRNTTHPWPFTAVFNYSNVDGLGMRWDRNIARINVEHDPSDTYGNATIVLVGDGSPETVFDGQRPALKVTLNVSKTNRTFSYYSERLNQYKRLEECASTPGAVEFSESCYTNTTSTVTAYIPEFINADRLFVSEPPDALSIIIGTNASLNQSIIPFNFSVTSFFPRNASFCSYNITVYNASNATLPYEAGTLNLAAFTIPEDQWVYRENITAADGRYNLSVNCTSEFGDTVRYSKNVTVSDNTTPQLWNVSSSNVDRRTATILGTSDENVNFMVYYGTAPGSLSLTESQPGQSTDAEITLSDLDEDTRYYYNLTACDLKGKCALSQTLSFTTLKPSTSSGGGGGGGVAPEEKPSELTDARVWGEVTSDTTLNYKTKLAFSAITLHFKEDAKSVKVTVKQYNGTPKGLINAPGMVYKYLSIDHQGLDSVDSRHIEVRIPTAWLQANSVPKDSVALYRFEDGQWVKYDAVNTGASGGDNYYTVAVPGFSYFAVSGSPPPPSQEATEGTQQSGGADPAETTTPSIENPKEFISAPLPKKGFSIPPWLLIALVVIVAGVGSVVGLKQYKQYQIRENERLEKLRIEGERQRVVHERVADHDPMHLLHAYISAQRAKGTPDPVIRQRLLSVGWDELVVDMELLRK